MEAEGVARTAPAAFVPSGRGLCRPWGRGAWELVPTGQSSTRSSAWSGMSASGFALRPQSGTSASGHWLRPAWSGLSASGLKAASILINDEKTKAVELAMRSSSRPTRGKMAITMRKMVPSKVGRVATGCALHGASLQWRLRF